MSDERTHPVYLDKYGEWIALDLRTPMTRADYIAAGHDLADVLPFAVDYTAERSEAMQAVLEAVSAARLRRVPSIAYIETEYQMLAQEADYYVSIGRPDEAPALVFLTDAAAISGNTLSEEADAIRAKRDAYVGILRATSTLRKEAQTALGAADDDVAAIEAVRDQYVSQLASL